MADGNTEIPEHQIAFDLPEDSPQAEPQQEDVEVKDSQKPEEPKPLKSVDNYRPYCGEGHGKMLPSKFGGYWCPKCRR